VLNAVQSLDEPCSPPENRLKALRGDFKGFHSVRVNQQWRLVFRWQVGGAYEVQLTDYHDQEVAVQPKHRVPTHPGEILLEEFLRPLGQTQVALAAHIGVPVQRVNELVRGKRGVTPETAWLLSQALGTSPEFWLNLQAAYDLAMSRPRRSVRKLRKAG
jgi:addiction module HigA family antidote